MDNTICYIEFMSNNLGQTSEFFNKLFGWKMTPSGDNYVIWDPGTGAEGGFQLEPLDKCGPEANRTIAYVQVDDIEAKCKQVENLGGTVVVPKTKISDEYGFFALFRDPQGTLVGLWNKT